jgi:hypothetical protein
MKDLPELTSEEMNSIEPILAFQTRRAKHTITLDYLLTKWVKLVMQVEEGYQLSIDDYNNAITRRDLLQEILDGSQQVTQEKLSSWLVEWDDRFKKATKEVEEPPFPYLPKEMQWWWYRIPLNPGDELKKWLSFTQ